MAYPRCSERAICEPNASDEWCINRVSGGVWPRHTAGLCGAFIRRMSISLFPLLSNDSSSLSFQPTPDSSDWDPTLDPYHNDTKYFGEMVAYMDKLVGDLIDVVDEVGLSEDTLIIFPADNGTDHRIISQQRGIAVPGAKGKMTGDATQVPFLVRWPKHVQKEIKIDGLIDFSDVFATLRDVAI